MVHSDAACSKLLEPASDVDVVEEDMKAKRLLDDRQARSRKCFQWCSAEVRGLALESLEVAQRGWFITLSPESVDGLVSVVCRSVGTSFCFFLFSSIFFFCRVWLVL